MHRHCPSSRKRAQGKPGADCTHGPRAAKSTGVGPQVNRVTPAFPAQWFTVYTCSPRRPGFVCLRRPAQRPAGLDSSVGESGPHDFAVRLERTRRARQSVHRIPRPTLVTIAKRPSCGHGTARTIRLILFSGKAKYFCWRGLTRFRKISPTGKSVVNEGAADPL